MYTGRAGQLAVMAELLHRGCNVADPEVDVGEDLLTYRNGETQIVHVQVKTANAEALKEPGRYAARVSVPLEQLKAEDRPPLHYIFPVRLADRWADFLIIGRAELFLLSRSHGIGYRNERAGELQLYLSFGPESVLCSSRDMQPYRNAWESLPVLQSEEGSTGGPTSAASPEGPSG
ncbi:MAG TPA: hypothetical protein VEL76_07650 [Gemmataceae bacterium]|nr:hypothetical protein [Gemmataceae bacterium]